MSENNTINITELLKQYPDLLSNPSSIAKFTKDCEELFKQPPTLENFFNNSKVSTFFSKNANKRLDNVIIDYDGRNYIRIMKLLKQTSKCAFSFGNNDLIGLSVNDKQRLIDEMNKSFHLRVYLPKNVIATKGKKIDRLVIMLNGLDELDNFKLYDILGEFFADNNIGAILLPTPFHLNRRIEPSNFDEQEKIFPTDRAKNGNELLFALNYLKSYKELNFLLDKIKGEDLSSDVEDDLGFYHQYFDSKNTEITLLGYSLGGLKMLGYFLKDFVSMDEKYADDKHYLQLFKERQKFHSCITVNSGLDLPLARIQNLSKKTNGEAEKELKKQEWRELMAIYRAALIKSQREDIFIGEDKELLELCELMYFPMEASHENWRKTINAAKSKILSVTAGDDEIVTRNQIQALTPSSPINQYILTSADHHLGMITGDWAEDIPRAENAILYFIKHCQETHYNERDIQKKIKELLDFVISTGGLRHYAIDDFRESFYEEHIADVLNCLPGDKKAEFRKYYFLSKAFFPNFPQLINKLYPIKNNP